MTEELALDASPGSSRNTEFGMQQRPGTPLARSATRPYLSIIVPIFNEEESLPDLVAQLTDAVAKIGPSYEIICIDDGSSDRSIEVLKSEAAKNPQLKVIALRRNYGQTAAMAPELTRRSPLRVDQFES